MESLNQIFLQSLIEKAGNIYETKKIILIMEIRYRSQLYKLLPANPIVAEIGCAEGLFSLDILRWPSGILYMVDNWETIPTQRGDGAFDQSWHDKNFDEAMHRVSEYKDNVIVLRGISWDMAKEVTDGTLDMVYIDACHSYECVKKDLEAWTPKVKKGGIVAGHDFLNNAYGVNQAVIEFCKGKYTINVISEHKNDDAGFYFIKV